MVQVFCCAFELYPVNGTSSISLQKLRNWNTNNWADCHVTGICSACWCLTSESWGSTEVLRGPELAPLLHPFPAGSPHCTLSSSTRLPLPPSEPLSLWIFLPQTSHLLLFQLLVCYACVRSPAGVSFHAHFSTLTLVTGPSGVLSGVLCCSHCNT